MRRLIGLLVLVFLVVPAVSLAGDTPLFPQQFRGDIAYFDDPIDSSFSLTAETSLGEFVCPIDDDGRYGHASKCLVDGARDDDVDFYISGSWIGDEMFRPSDPGEVTERDFDIDDILVSSPDIPVDFSTAGGLDIDTNVRGLYMTIHEKAVPNEFGDSDVFFMKRGEPILQFDSSFSDIIESSSCSGDCITRPLFSFGGPVTGKLKLQIEIPEEEDATSYRLMIRSYSDSCSGDYTTLINDNGITAGEHDFDFDLQDSSCFRVYLYYYTIIAGYSIAPESFSMSVLGAVDISDFVDSVKGTVIETQEEGAGIGYTLIRGLNLPDGISKAVYLDRVSRDAEYLCLKDAELDSISELSNDCSGSGEYKIPASGGTVGGYTVTLIDGGDRYKIEGLSNSAVKQVVEVDASKISVSGLGKRYVRTKSGSDVQLTAKVTVKNEHSIDYYGLYFEMPALKGKYTSNQNLEIPASSLAGLPTAANKFSLSAGVSREFDLVVTVPPAEELEDCGIATGNIILYAAGESQTLPFEVDVLQPLGGSDDEGDDEQDKEKGDEKKDDGDDVEFGSGEIIDNATTPPPEAADSVVGAITSFLGFERPAGAGDAGAGEQGGAVRSALTGVLVFLIVVILGSIYLLFKREIVGLVKWFFRALLGIKPKPARRGRRK